MKALSNNMNIFLCILGALILSLLGLLTGYLITLNEVPKCPVCSTPLQDGKCLLCGRDGII
jgi:hypothetical protein